MKLMNFCPKLTLLPLFCFFLAVQSAHADYTSRFSLGVGIVTFQNPSTTELQVGAEYEYRVTPMWGLGLFADVIFTNPIITDLGAPEVFWHPFETAFLISAAPLFEFGDSDGTHVGVHFGTRIPISLGQVKLIPIIGVAFIDHTTRPDFGLGIEF
jgi:hypothetical protein